MSRTGVFRALLAGTLAAACAGAPADGPTSTSAETIVGGEDSGPEDDFVVQIFPDEPEPYTDFACSGALVAPNVVLTALHCVSVFDGDRYGCQPDGSTDPSGAGWIGEPLEPANVAVRFGTEAQLTFAAHGLEIFGSHSTFACVDDIAFVVLDTALPARGVALRNERPVVKGESLTVIGYGQSEVVDARRRRRPGVTVIDVGPDDQSEGLGTLPARNFLVDDGPCGGDEGAPALSEETGAVVGVFRQTVSGNCLRAGSYGGFVQVAPLIGLARQAFEAAGAKLRLETPSPAPLEPRTSCTLAPGDNTPATAAPALGVLALLLLRRRMR